MAEIVRCPHCAPTKEGAAVYSASWRGSAKMPRVFAGPLEDLVCVGGGSFLMGSESPGTLPENGEAPVRTVTLRPFAISPRAITNRQFAVFVRKTGYKTEAERLGWSFVFKNFVGHPSQYASASGTHWWLAVPGAAWDHPFGPDSGVVGMPHHPVVHVSWNDAVAYCIWKGYRLPTEAEWEYAARGGQEQKTYPWGDELMPGGNRMCRTWQGVFPDLDLRDDGYTSTVPAHSFEPNGFGLFNMVGNAWEWCGDWFHPTWHAQASLLDPVGPPSGDTRVMRGGSYLCHASYCRRYRHSARTGTAPDSSTGHIGFRVVRDL